MIACFGYALTANFFSGVKVSFLVKLISAFFIGYTCIIGIIRILSFALPYEQIYLPVAALTLCLTFILLFRSGFKWKEWLTDAVRSYKGIIFTTIFTGGFIFLILILQIYQGGMQWVGHGPGQYAYLLNEYRAQNLAHFPVITQHYEELIFHYFLTMPLNPDFNPILPWWTTLALTKASMFVFIYAAFRKLGTSFWLSSIFSLFMMLGSFSLLLTKNYVIIDSGNPIAYIVHPGRIVQIGFAIILIIDSIYRSSGARHLPGIFFLLGGLGLAATSISNILWIMALYALTVASVSFYNRQDIRALAQEPQAGGKLICWTAAAAALLMYKLPMEGQHVFTIRAVLIALILQFFLHQALPQIYAGLPVWKNKLSGYTRALWLRVFILTASGCASLLFLGNVFVNNKMARFLTGRMENLFGQINIQSTTVYADRGAAPLSLGNFTRSGELYRTGFPQFCAAFGGILAVILSAAYLLEKGRKSGRIKTGPENVLLEITAALAVSVPCVFFFMDFVNIHSYGWLMSRFLEIPVYISIFIFLHSINRFCGRPLKFALSILLLSYVVVPFIANNMPEQIRANWKVFVALLNS
ncbi:MAG: hypothetical protein V1662_03495 [Candidatus Omnitrophota bacterium]